MIATLLLWYFAVCGVLANLAAVGVWLFVWRLPETELDDAPLDVVAKPSNVRVIRGDSGAVRVDWAAWLAVVGLVAVLALAGWAS